MYRTGVYPQHRCHATAAQSHKAARYNALSCTLDPHSWYREHVRTYVRTGGNRRRGLCSTFVLLPDQRRIDVLVCTSPMLIHRSAIRAPHVYRETITRARTWIYGGSWPVPHGEDDTYIRCCSHTRLYNSNTDSICIRSASFHSRPPRRSRFVASLSKPSLLRVYLTCIRHLTRLASPRLFPSTSFLLLP